jgi:hypothetical protein
MTAFGNAGDSFSETCKHRTNVAAKCVGTRCHAALKVQSRINWLARYGHAVKVRQPGSTPVRIGVAAPVRAAWNLRAEQELENKIVSASVPAGLN